jgi:hypothetical protein
LLSDDLLTYSLANAYPWIQVEDNLRIIELNT